MAQTKLIQKAEQDLEILFNLQQILPLSVMSLAHYGSVEIELIVAETENWKHYNKIIFKYVNSVVGLIFNIFKYVNSTATVHKQYYYSVATVIIVPWPKAKHVKWGGEKQWKNATQDSTENAESKRALYIGKFYNKT